MNTAFNLLGRAWNMVIAFLMTPYIMKHMGVDRFGVWALVSVVTGYFGLLDMGIGTSYVKYISEHYVKRDFAKINEIVNSGFVFYLAFTAAIMLLAFVLQNAIIGFFNIPNELGKETLFVFWVGLLTFCVVNAASSFVAVQSGLQRMDVYNKISLVMSVPSVILSIFVLEKGYSLRGLIVVNAIVMILSGLANAIASFKLLPQLELSVRHVSKDTFKTLLGYGSKLQVARIASTITMQIDKLLLSHYMSIGFVTFFQLASSVIEQVKALPLLLLQALLPAFSELDARGNRAGVIDNYIRGTRYIALFALPIFALVLVSARDIMLVWMGPGYDQSAIIIRILAVGWAAAVISGVRSVVLQAIAKPGIEMRAGIVAAVLNIPLSVFFIKQFGFAGVALGTSLALIVSALYGFSRLNAALHLQNGFYVKTRIPQVIIGCICAGMIALASTGLLGGRFGGGRVESMLLLCAQTAVFAAVYAALLRIVQPLDATDIAKLTHAVPGLPRRLIEKFASVEN
ncbi:MAG: polysaccharide biosynthesis C-terminal domain-containing protein [Elusimicrobiales bacterium]